MENEFETMGSSDGSDGDSIEGQYDDAPLWIAVTKLEKIG